MINRFCGKANLKFIEQNRKLIKNLIIGFVRFKLSVISAKFINPTKFEVNPSIEMEIASHVSVEELNAILGSMQDAYAWLSQKYYLPSLNSKAITKLYLFKVIAYRWGCLKST